MQGRERECREENRLRLRRSSGDDGFSMIGIVLSLVASALLVAILLGTTLSSNGTSGTGISNAPGVAEATSLQAEQTLSTGLTTVDAAAASDGGYASLNTSTLSASNPSTLFIAGPSTNATTISMAVASGSGGAGGGTGGSVTLADRSPSGTCWLVWRSTGSSTWYGAQAGQSSCTAPAISSVPSPGPVSATSIGWQQDSFPAP
jgi:hypothetical protein